MGEGQNKQNWPANPLGHWVFSQLHLSVRVYILDIDIRPFPSNLPVLGATKRLCKRRLPATSAQEKGHSTECPGVPGGLAPPTACRSKCMPPRSLNGAHGHFFLPKLGGTTHLLCQALGPLSVGVRCAFCLRHQEGSLCCCCLLPWGLLLKVRYLRLDGRRNDQASLLSRSLPSPTQPPSCG